MRFRKKIFEAIVAVPFWFEDGERKFFKTWDPKAAATQSVAGETYKKLFKMMKKYVFPPTFDFVNNPTQGSEGVKPIAMYVFEFSHTLNQDDLSHIWQNLPPRLGTAPQISTSTIRHQLLANELMGDPSEAIEASRDKKNMASAKMKDKIQWMIFKVKQRAKGDYFTEIDGRESVMPLYTYNWPYDYFSFVEMVQLEVGVEFQSKRNPEGTPEAIQEQSTGQEDRFSDTSRIGAIGSATPGPRTIDEIIDDRVVDWARTPTSRRSDE
jgi:hypothetical protein